MTIEQQEATTVAKRDRTGLTTLQFPKELGILDLARWAVTCLESESPHQCRISKGVAVKTALEEFLVKREYIH
jgi:hypothetical protein